MAPLLRAIGDRFHTLHPRVEVQVRAGGSGHGIREARSGAADIGMASRALHDGECDLFGFPVAREGICAVVHRDNPVRELTDRQLLDVYTGKVARWSGVGGRDAPIRVIGRSHGRSEAELFTHYLIIREGDLRVAAEAGDNQVAVGSVAADPDAIVYVSVGEVEREVRRGLPVKPLPLRGVEATTRNVRSGYYPMSRPLTLVTRTRPDGTAKEFLDFATSPQVTDLIRAYHFVPYLD
jgi:phosphate transport system substrate-binding protein